MSGPLPDAVGVFDSGFGGLSVLRSIRARLPQERLLYVSDSGHAPYGDRSEEFIVERTVRIGRWLAQARAKAIVVACNTATTVAIRALREAVSLPVIGIEPAVKPAAAMTRTGRIAVMATTRTIASLRYRALVQRFAGGVEVLSCPCPGLVEFVEAGDLRSQAVRQLVGGYVRPLVAAGVDTITLACTHYPFLADLIAEQAPGVTVFEPGPAVAAQLERRLAERGALAPKGPPGQTSFYASGATPARQRLVTRLWGEASQLSELPV